MIWKSSGKRIKQKHKIQWKGHSSRLEQAEDRISEHEDKMEIKGKTEELLVKQLKTYERNMQELSNSIKRPNLRIMALKKEKRCKQKGFIIYSIK
jgi:TolA-binding protein